MKKIASWRWKDHLLPSESTHHFGVQELAASISLMMTIKRMFMVNCGFFLTHKALLIKWHAHSWKFLPQNQILCRVL